MVFVRYGLYISWTAVLEEELSPAQQTPITDQKDEQSYFKPEVNEKDTKPDICALNNLYQNQGPEETKTMGLGFSASRNSHIVLPYKNLAGPLQQTSMPYGGIRTVARQAVFRTRQIRSRLSGGSYKSCKWKRRMSSINCRVYLHPICLKIPAPPGSRTPFTC